MKISGETSYNETHNLNGISKNYEMSAPCLMNQVMLVLFIFQFSA